MAPGSVDREDVTFNNTVRRRAPHGPYWRLDMTCLHVRFGMAIGAGLFALACGGTAVPTAPSASQSALPGPQGLSANSSSPTAGPWGPETPHFNLEVILRGEGFGLVKFRQPNDDALVIHLDTWVRDLAPNTSYLLQRAVDVNVDDNCTGTGWITLGKGAQPQAITTDARGTGREELFRSVAAFPIGSEFDIHFRVISAASSAVVLTSECYQFTISQ